MRFATLALFLLALTGCNSADEQRTREQARQTGEVVKHDAREAVHEVKVDTAKATKELDNDLHETRDKVRKALDAPPDNTRR
jgi:hypothetical protein